VSYVEDYFGNCPECGRTDGCLNIYKVHWYRRNVHKTKWPVGMSFFDSWRHEDDEVWEENWRLLSDYDEVEAITPPQAYSDDQITEIILGWKER
jgi:hypothetical protein